MSLLHVYCYINARFVILLRQDDWRNCFLLGVGVLGRGWYFTLKYNMNILYLSVKTESIFIMFFFNSCKHVSSFGTCLSSFHYFSGISVYVCQTVLAFIKSMIWISTLFHCIISSLWYWALNQALFAGRSQSLDQP